MRPTQPLKRYEGRKPTQFTFGRSASFGRTAAVWSWEQALRNALAKTVLKSGFETSFKSAIEKQFPKRFREMLPETALENDCRNQLVKQVTVNFPDPGGPTRVPHRPQARPREGKYSKRLLRAIFRQSNWYVCPVKSYISSYRPTTSNARRPST